MYYDIYNAHGDIVGKVWPPDDIDSAYGDKSVNVGIV